MAKFTLELSINNELVIRTVEAHGVAIQDENKGFIAFYIIEKIVDGQEKRKTLINYNLAYIVSMVKEDE